MDTKFLTEGDNLSVKLVGASPSKRGFILSGGVMVNDVKSGKQRFELLVEIDGTRKNYRPNSTTLENIQAKYGYDSNKWVGAVLTFKIAKLGQFDSVIGECQ